MAINTIWLGIGVFLFGYMLLWYRKTRNWVYLLTALILLSVLPFPVLRILLIPYKSILREFGWWWYGLVILGVICAFIIILQLISDTKCGRN